MQPTAGETCGTYLRDYAALGGGRVYNPDAMADCQYCTASNADQFLQSVAISYTTRWRDYGIGFAYIGFNIFMAVLLYYLIRVRKGSGKSMAEKLSPILGLFKKDPKKENTGPERKKAPQDKAE